MKVDSKPKANNVVVIPVFNEARAISRIVKAVLDNPELDLIVVDDGSSDGTAQILERFEDKIITFKMPSNSGKGAAMRAGADIAYNMRYKNIVFMDGDGQHDPKDIGKIMAGLKKSEMVINHRMLDFQTSAVSKFGRFVVRSVFNTLFATKIRDHLSGFRAIRRSAYPKIRWQSDDYRVEIEMLARAVFNKVTYCEISSPCGQRRYKGMGWGSGLQIVINIFHYRALRSKLKYSPANKGRHY